MGQTLRNIPREALSLGQNWRLINYSSQLDIKQSAGDIGHFVHIQIRMRWGAGYRG